MTRQTLFVGLSAGAVAAALAAALTVRLSVADERPPEKLPEPKETSDMSLEQALANRRSVREYTSAPLTEEQIAQLCWAAQGITDAEQGLRTAPSAGALYPLELYVVTPGGVRHYVPGKHALRWHAEGDLRGKLSAAALHQPWVEKAPAVFVFAGVFERTEKKYGERGGRYVWMEAGHAAENLLLQATAMELGAVPVGAFRDEQVAAALNLPAKHRPLYVIPVGYPSKEREE
jgi:SagB-type dehydrogenase family enzyme